MTARSTWKRAERMIAADIGGKRIPVTGIDRDGADVVGGPFHYQVKLRRSLPVWLFAWLSGICASAQQSGKTGVLVLNTPRQPRRNAVVCVRWDDWVAMHGEAGTPRPVDSEPE